MKISLGVLALSCEAEETVVTASCFQRVIPPRLTNAQPQLHRNIQSGQSPWEASPKGNPSAIFSAGKQTPCLLGMGGHHQGWPQWGSCVLLEVLLLTNTGVNVTQVKTHPCCLVQAEPFCCWEELSHRTVAVLLSLEARSPKRSHDNSCCFTFFSLGTGRDRNSAS